MRQSLTPKSIRYTESDDAKATTVKWENSQLWMKLTDSWLKLWPFWLIVCNYRNAHSKMSGPPVQLCKVKAKAQAAYWRTFVTTLISACKRPASSPPWPLTPTQVTPQCRVNKCRQAGLQSIWTGVLEEDLATSVHHCPVGWDGLPPGAITQLCNVYWGQSSSNYVNESSGGRPSPLFKPRSGACVCTPVLCNFHGVLDSSEWELHSR